MAGDTGEYCQRDANSHIKNMREDRGDVSSSARLRTEKRLGEAGSSEFHVWVLASKMVRTDVNEFRSLLGELKKDLEDLEGLEDLEDLITMIGNEEDVDRALKAVPVN